MDIVKKINLDFSTPMPPEIIRVRRGDTARILEIHLFNGGLALNISAGATATLAVTKPSGVKLKKTITTERENNVISIALTSEMTNELGRCPATLEVTDNLTAASNVFTVLVEDNPAYEAAESGSAVLQEKTVEATHYERIVTPDPGYDGLSKVTVEAIPTVSRATPTVTIDQSTGKITAQSVQSAGYVNAGTQTKTLQLPTAPGQTVTAGATKKLIAAAGTYATGDIYVAADSSPTFITQPEKTVNVTSDANGNISPAYVVADSPYDALGRVNLSFSGGSLNASKIKKGEKILGVTGTYEGSGGGSSIGTVPVTILDTDALVGTVIATYTALDSGGNPFVTSATVIKSDWNSGEPIHVVKGTVLTIESGNETHEMDFDGDAGFAHVSVTDGVLICHVGDVACSITPAQVERASEESGNSIIVGKWTFHSSITQYPPESGFDVNFKCEDGTECNRIATSVANGTWQMVYFDAADGAVFDAVLDGQFDDASVQTIDFGTEPQTIPAEFAEWLAANADYKASGGGSAIETYRLTLNNVQSLTGDTVCIPYVNDNGELAYLNGYETLGGYEGVTLNVPQNAILYIKTTSLPIVCWDGEFEDINKEMYERDGAKWYRMIMDTEIGVG